MMVFFPLLSLASLLSFSADDQLQSALIRQALSIFSRVRKVQEVGRNLEETASIACFTDQMALNEMYEDTMNKLLISPPKECAMEKNQEFLSIICDFAGSSIFDDAIAACMESDGRIMYLKNESTCSTKSVHSMLKFTDVPWCIANSCQLDWFIQMWKNEIETDNFYECETSLEFDISS